MRMRHMHRRAFVTYIDDAYTMLSELIPDRLDVTTLQTEYAVYPMGNKKFGDQLGDTTGR